jgi:CPA2 family monovalent cation:H+ antiporter-2
MHTIDLLHDLAVVLIVAGIVTLIFHKLKQPVVLGYLLAGVIIGPHTPPKLLVNDEQDVEVLAQLGMVFLMFSLGLHFSLRKLGQVGLTAFIVALLEIALMVWIGFDIGQLFGWSRMDSLFLGAIMAISSTTIIVKALSELGLLRERFAESVFGILVVEDILGIAMIALLSGIAMTGTFQAGAVMGTLGRLGVFLAVLVVLGLLVVPRLLRFIGEVGSREMLLVSTLGLCFGVTLLAMELGYSLALGAFLIGAIMAETRERARIDQLVKPVKDLFSAVFFVSIGMLIDPRLLVEYAWPIAVVTVAVVLGKILSCALGAFLTGNDPRTSVRIGMSLAQIGEFSFIIAQLGLTLGVTSRFLYPIAVMVSAITTFLTPFLITRSETLVAKGGRWVPKPVAAVAAVYHEWARGLLHGPPAARSGVARFFRRFAIQLVVNVSLVTAIFAIATALVPVVDPMLAGLPWWLGGTRTILWFGAMVCALPLLVHTWWKLKAMAYVLAEMSLAGVPDKAHALRARAVISTLILSIGSVAMALWMLLVGLAIQPPWPVLTALAIVLVAIAILAWRACIQLYSRAQVSLQETMTAIHHDEPEALPHLSVALREAEIENVPIQALSRAAGRRIKDLGLRSRTGATIVGLDREAGSVINPGPEDEIKAGDTVVLLGKRSHLDEARRLLA